MLLEKTNKPHITVICLTWIPRTAGPSCFIPLIPQLVLTLIRSELLVAAVISRILTNLFIPQS